MKNKYFISKKLKNTQITVAQSINQFYANHIEDVSTRSHYCILLMPKPNLLLQLQRFHIMNCLSELSRPEYKILTINDFITKYKSLLISPISPINQPNELTFAQKKSICDQIINTAKISTPEKATLIDESNNIIGIFKEVYLQLVALNKSYHDKMANRVKQFLKDWKSFRSSAAMIIQRSYRSYDAQKELQNARIEVETIFKDYQKFRNRLSVSSFRRFYGHYLDSTT